MENNYNECNIDLNQFQQIEEGQAKILFPKGNEVFYNPVQQFNRDLSIAVIQHWLKQNHDKKFQQFNQKKFNKNQLNKDFQPFQPKILEALAATGLRSIRYFKEIENIGSILVNDLEPQAVDAIKRNLKFNNLSEDKVIPNLGDAIDVMYQHRQPDKRFDCIDLDPYGSASPFIDAAVQSIKDDGLLCVTCTDLAVLASTQHTETCFNKYGGIPLKANFCHEMALRLVIQAIQTSASRYKRLVTPLISCSIDFYVRIFFKVTTSPSQIKLAASKTSLVYKCSGCGSFKLNSLGKVTNNNNGNIKFGLMQGPNVDQTCEYCEHKLHIGGPIYNGPLHDIEFVKSLLDQIRKQPEKFHTFKRMEGMLTVISEELINPLLYSPSELSMIVKSSTPSIVNFRSALLNSGYKVSASHTQPGSFKTDAPTSFIWDILRAWIKLHPVKMENFKSNAAGLKILEKEASVEINFEKHPEADLEKLREIKLVRFQVNPEKFWGPKPRHKRKGNDSNSTLDKENKKTEV